MLTLLADNNWYFVGSGTVYVCVNSFTLTPRFWRYTDCSNEEAGVESYYRKVKIPYFLAYAPGNTSRQQFYCHLDYHLIAVHKE
jgi:hypothetical protein